MATRVPLTLVTGYLGAGKTTLLNALLRDPSSGRIAVVVNEFGDVGLDHDLIVESTEETVLLSSGCMCCTVRGDLVQALERLLDERAAGKLNFDRIVLETTGLADPAPILHSIIVTPKLAALLKMDGVVTLCDAVNGAKTLDAGFESVSQVAMADVVVVSKTDLVSASVLAGFQARLTALAPGARQLIGNSGVVRTSDLFDLGPPEVDGDLSGAVGWVNASAYPKAALPLAPAFPVEQPAGTTHGLFGLGGGSRPPVIPMPVARHDDRIASVSAEFDEPIHPLMLDIWLETLLSAVGPQVLRLKAVIWAEGFATPFVIHGVQHIMDPPIRLKSWSGIDRKSRVVLIGRDLSREALVDSLDVLRTKPETQRLA